MLGRNLGLTISCALGASAFLLPPGVSSDKDAVLPFVAIDPKHQYLELPCASCKSLDVLSTGRHEVTVDEAPGNLLLDFTISKDGQALLLNQEQIYPLDYAIDDIEAFDWFVQHLDADVTREEIEAGLVGTPLQITAHGYSTSPVDMLTPDGDGVITIKWQLLALEHQMMNVDDVLIQLLRTGDGELLILSADIIPTPEEVYTIQPIKPIMPLFGPPRPVKGCKYLPGPLCDMSKFFDSKMGAFKHGKPCGGAKKFNPFEGRLPTHIKPHFGRPDEQPDMPFVPPFARESPEHHGHPHMHGHHRHHHGMLHAIANGIEAILVPVILGLGVGLIVAPLGFLTGRLIAWLWFSVFRGGKRGYARVALEDEGVDTDKSRDSLESVEPLPRYENAPAYEETEKEAL